MSFFAELKRRNVFRVGIAYLVTAWLVSQVVELAADSFEAPAWVMKMIITMLALGLPLALIFAWAFELTPEGLRREKNVVRSHSITHTTGRKLDFVIITVLALALGYFAIDKFVIGKDAGFVPVADMGILPVPVVGPEQPALQVEPNASDEGNVSLAGAREKSIAVLPFTNRSAGGENTQFLSDGIHDDLLTNLSKIHELKVISRTSVMTYRDTTKNMRQIGDELGVSNLLEGAVQQVGERVRINVQLIDARTDEHLWADSFDREISTENIFEIQGEIARAIAFALEATLSPEENEGIGRSPTANFQAYQAVLMSRQALRLGTFDFQEAADYARKAIEIDPDYADAYLALAFALSQSIYAGSESDDEVGTEISKAIGTAMVLRPGYDQAWSALGHYQAATGDIEAAESFKKAMQLNPGNVRTLFAYGNMLQTTGKPQQALPLLLEASERDPLSQLVLFVLGRTYDVLEKHEESRKVYARIRDIHPASALGYTPVSGTYYAQGQIDLALYWLDQGQTIDPQDFELAGWMVLLHDCLEDYAAASEWSQWLDSWVTNQPQPMAMQAAHHYRMGNFETALQYSNLALRLGLPNRWGSDAIFMRIKRDEALADGEPDTGIAVFRTHHPGLFDEAPQITSFNLQQAVDLALLFKLTGMNDEMQRLLKAVIEFYDQPYAVTGSSWAHLVSAKAEALAIMDDENAALSELKRIIDKGWRINWRWETELNFNFNGIRETPEFKDMVTDLQADMAFQRANVDAMIARGDVRKPPRQ